MELSFKNKPISSFSSLTTHQGLCYSKSRFNKGARLMGKDPRLFDIIVLAGMVVNIILAVFLLIYYFDLL